MLGERGMRSEDFIYLREIDRKADFLQDVLRVEPSVAKHLLDDIPDIQARSRDNGAVKLRVVFPEPVGIEEDHRGEIRRCLGIIVLFTVLKYLAERPAGTAGVDNPAARPRNERLFADAILEIFGVCARQRWRRFGSIVPCWYRKAFAPAGRRSILHVQRPVEPQPCLVENIVHSRRGSAIWANHAVHWRQVRYGRQIGQSVSKGAVRRLAE